MPQNYQTSITTKVSPEEAYKKISNVSAWWSKHFEGKTEKAGDVFTVSFGPNGEKDRFKIQITEAGPGKKIVWKVLESKQDWVKNSAEWTGTEIVWEIFAEANGSKITMTHKGLTPELECYKMCNSAWSWLTSESLFKLLQDNMGTPV